MQSPALGTLFLCVSKQEKIYIDVMRSLRGGGGGGEKREGLLIRIQIDIYLGLLLFILNFFLYDLCDLLYLYRLESQFSATLHTHAPNTTTQILWYLHEFSIPVTIPPPPPHTPPRLVTLCPFHFLKGS